jgi:CO/xanthine dehydrogenase FAD-binding subunit
LYRAPPLRYAFPYEFSLFSSCSLFVLLFNEIAMLMAPRYLRPLDLSQALAMSLKFRPKLMAGGTDFYPAHADRSVAEDVLDLSCLQELRGISDIKRDGKPVLRIGAMVSWSDALLHPALAGSSYLALRQCSREVGGQQIQNRGTLVGNVCNASPAADGVPALMALGANVEISASQGQRSMALERFVMGPRQIALEPGEIVTALEIPVERTSTRSVFLKMGSRRYLVISIAMLAAQWRPGRQGLCRIAIGACSPVALRLEPLERWYLDGMKVSQKADALQACLNLLRPIDDVRADQQYRRDLAIVLCEKLMAEMHAPADHIGSR